MKKRLVLLLVLGIILISACEVEEEYHLCPDNVTNVLDLADCPKEKPTCIEECDDEYVCTVDICDASTDYKCVHVELVPCDGNAVCEEGEYPWSSDCPTSCDDGDKCTVDTYSYALGDCFYDKVIPCCGNEICDTGETFVACPIDCEQLLNIKVINYIKGQRVTGAYTDLTGTDYMYIIVDFVMHNIAIDQEETLDYRTGNGFYYDPYKMRLEGGNGKLYDIEYDSDLVENYLDYNIIPKGHTVTAGLLFVVPLNLENVRLVAYDRYGARLDVGEVY